MHTAPRRSSVATQAVGGGDLGSETHWRFAKAELKSLIEAARCIIQVGGTCFVFPRFPTSPSPPSSFVVCITTPLAHLRLQNSGDNRLIAYMPARDPERES